MFDVFYPLTKRSDRQSYRNPKPPRSKKPRKEEKENKNFTYVYPVQSSTWFDPWLTATTSHSAHWSAERSMADVFSYNPSKTQFLDLSKRNPHRVQFSFSNRFASDFTRNPTLSIDCVCVSWPSHDYTQHFKIRYCTVPHQRKEFNTHAQTCTNHWRGFKVLIWPRCSGLRDSFVKSHKPEESKFKSPRAAQYKSRDRVTSARNQVLISFIFFLN